MPAITKNPGKAALLEMYEKHRMTQQQIANALGVALASVQRWMLAEGIEPRQGRESHTDASKKVGRPPKRGAVVAGGRAIDRLRPEDQARVKARVADFLRYVRWQRVMEEDGLIRVYE